MHRSSLTIAASTVALLGLFAANAKAVIDPSAKCESGKLKESAKYVSCRLKAEAKAAQQETTPDFSKCTAKFPLKYNEQETKAGPGICPTEGDGASIDAWLIRDTDDLAILIAGGVVSQVLASGQTTTYGAGDDGDLEPGIALQYVDNGDGTISDSVTGLMWEKKTLGTGAFTACTDETGTCADPHHADNAYEWTIFTPPFESYDGTVVTIFLEQLNARCNDDTTVACTVDADCAVPGGPCGFAGHQDWRLPTKRELESIVDAGTFSPSVNAAFQGASCGPACTDITDAACSCTSSADYWSSTTLANNATLAWLVNFDAGQVFDFSKFFPTHARAVRGGS